MLKHRFLWLEIQWVMVSYDWRIWWVVSYKSVSYRKGMRVLSNCKWNMGQIFVAFSDYLIFIIRWQFWPIFDPSQLPTSFMDGPIPTYHLLFIYFYCTEFLTVFSYCFFSQLKAEWKTKTSKMAFCYLRPKRQVTKICSERDIYIA